jgi:hypothetical protein
VFETATCLANNRTKFKGDGPHVCLNSVASGRLESAEQLVFMQDFVDLWLVHIRPPRRRTTAATSNSGHPALFRHSVVQATDEAKILVYPER